MFFKICSFLILASVLVFLKNESIKPKPYLGLLLVCTLLMQPENIGNYLFYMCVNFIALTTLCTTTQMRKNDLNSRHIIFNLLLLGAFIGYMIVFLSYSVCSFALVPWSVFMLALLFRNGQEEVERLTLYSISILVMFCIKLYSNINETGHILLLALIGYELWAPKIKSVIYPALSGINKK